MSGHSKWATIKHKKSAADAKRGQIFSKLSKELMVVARKGGSNPELNAALRSLIQKAKSYNMPSENIERAIKKGAGELGTQVFEEVVYEGYAPGGVALVVMCLTDNRNRAAAEIRHVFSRHGSNLAAQGSVTRNFQRKGQIIVDASKVDEDKLLGIVLEAGAEDVQQDNGHFEILTDPSAFNDVTAALEKAGIEMLSAEISLIPTTPLPVTREVARAAMKFIADLEECEDVQNVYTNMDISDEVLKELEQEEKSAGRKA